MATQNRGYEHNAYVSYKQAGILGGNVKKGEKATWIYFFKWLDITEKQNGAEKSSRVPVLRAFPVFNIEQCEGHLNLPERVLPTPSKSKGALGVVGPVVNRLNLEGGLKFGGLQAFYAPSVDAIQMPKVENFKSKDGFLATLLHECGHATGHRCRLQRDFNARFGDSSYAFEELVAELASAFTQAALGLKADVENHASYIHSWMGILEQDRHAFPKACRLAQHASDYMLGVMAQNTAEAAA